MPNEAGANLLGSSSPSSWKQQREDQPLSSVAKAVDETRRATTSSTDSPWQAMQVAVLGQSSQCRLSPSPPTDLGALSEVQPSQLVGAGMAQPPDISQHRQITSEGLHRWCLAPTHDQLLVRSRRATRRPVSLQEGETVNGSSRRPRSSAPMGSDPWLRAGTRRPTRTPTGR